LRNALASPLVSRDTVESRCPAARQAASLSATIEAC